MNVFACKYCIMTKGLRGSDVKDLPKNEEELFQHIEREHHIPVQQEGESPGMALKRFRKENPDAGGPNCRCPSCGAMAGAMALLLSLGGQK